MVMKLQILQETENFLINHVSDWKESDFGVNEPAIPKCEPEKWINW
jgi:hypothetical protein